MKRGTIIRAILSAAMLMYMVVMLSWVSVERKSFPCEGVVVEISDTTHTDFVTQEAILAELGPLIRDAKGKPLNSINTDSIERILSRVDKIEEATAVRRSDGKIYIAVTPLRPVMRVFEHDGRSYYVNKDGKRMTASLRYRIDVPLVVNEGHKGFNAVSLLPLLEKLRRDSLYSNMMTAINITRGGDIILVPSIRGMMINFGDTDNVDNKLARLNVMYKEVLPVKGWTYYDTLSVKWHGQVVASRRFKHEKQEEIDEDEIHDEEGDDIGTVMADATAIKAEVKHKPTEKAASAEKKTDKGSKADNPPKEPKSSSAKKST